MTSWADGSGALQAFDDAESGTGRQLAGQRDLSGDERANFRSDLDAYKASSGQQLSAITGGRMDSATSSMVSAYRIGQASDDALWGQKQEYLKAAQQQPLGDLTDPAARLKALSFITQDTPDQEGASVEGGGGPVDQSVCAGASIVGAAFLANGPDGLRQVMSAIEAQDPKGISTGKFASPEYKKLKEKLAKDPNSLSVADIQALQQTTYEVLRTNQDPGIVPEGENGVHGKTMDDFMQKSPQLAKMLEKNGMQIEGIDNDGELDADGRTAMDHWVVRIKGPDGKQAIYDPLARRGGQVIDFDEGVDHYTRARQDVVGQD